MLDGDVFAALVFLWIATVIRIGAAVLRSESFGQELGLAIVVVLALPWIARANLVGACGRRSRTFSRPAPP